MDQSPPKRVTRARAAAKAADSTIKTAKITTASAKARVTRATATTTTKRKTRSDDAEELAQENIKPPTEAPVVAEPVKTTRGRPRKAAVSEPAVEPAPEAPK